MANTRVDTLNKAIKKAKSCGADSAKVSYYKSDSLSVGFEAGRLKETATVDKHNFSISVLVDGKIGVVSGNRLDQIEQLTEQAVALAAEGKPAHFENWPGQSLFQNIDTFAETTAAMTRQNFIDKCEDIIEQIKQYNSDLFICANGAKGVAEQTFLTSEGLVYSKKSSSWSLSGMVQRTLDNDIMFASEGRNWRDLNEYYDSSIIAEKIIVDLKNAEQNVDAPKNDVPVFLAPNILYNLLYPVWLGINGLNVFKGESPLKDRLGEQVLDTCFNIVDNPHVPFATSATEIDGDGVPTQTQGLFEQGVLKAFLYDLDTAGMAGVKSTGNRGCSPYNVVIEKGSQDNDSLLAQVDDGIYIKSLMGFGQGNIINGDFSCNLALGYRIQNGRIAGRVKDVMVSGNVYEILKRNVQLSSETNYPGFLPYAIVEGISISSK